MSSYVKTARVKQVLADLALSPVAGHQVETLSQSEYRRLAIGVQLVRDPVVLLLDEPTWDLDPLNTYFVISILANHAKKVYETTLKEIFVQKLQKIRCFNMNFFIFFFCSTIESFF